MAMIVWPSTDFSGSQNIKLFPLICLLVSRRQWVWEMVARVCQRWGQEEAAVPFPWLHQAVSWIYTCKHAGGLSAPLHTHTFLAYMTRVGVWIKGDKVGIYLLCLLCCRGDKKIGRFSIYLYIYICIHMHIPERMPVLVTFLPNVTSACVERVRGRSGKGRSVTIVVIDVIIIERLLQWLHPHVSYPEKNPYVTVCQPCTICKSSLCDLYAILNAIFLALRGKYPRDTWRI